MPIIDVRFESMDKRLSILGLTDIMVLGMCVGIPLLISPVEAGVGTIPSHVDSMNTLGLG